MLCKHLTYAEWRRVLPREINNPSEGGHSQPMYEILRWYWRLRGCMMRSSTSIYVPRQDIREKRGWQRRYLRYAAYSFGKAWVVIGSI